MRSDDGSPIAGTSEQAPPIGIPAYALVVIALGSMQLLGFVLMALAWKRQTAAKQIILGNINV